jgi:16S rRNA (uracil1498-N3)-methyltransferase
MRVPRLLVAPPLAAGSRELEGDAAHHLLRVLRRRPGDPVELFDGTGVVARARLVAGDARRCTVEVESILEGDGGESPLAVHLGLALLRGERMDVALQKACELGVARITLLDTTRVEVRLDGKRLENRLRHWQGVLVHAAQQSGRARLPELFGPVSLLAFCEGLADDGPRLVLDPEGTPLAPTAEPPARAVLVTGPEGGLAPEDLAALDDAGFRPTALGPRVLRAETAPLAGLAVLQWLWGDLAGGR